MDNNSENQFSKYILGNNICKCKTLINTYTIVWYRLSKLKYKPNCPYNSKQLTFLVKAVRETVRSIIYSLPPDIHFSAYVRTLLKETSISLNTYSPIIYTISISLFFENKKQIDLCVMRDAAQ